MIVGAGEDGRDQFRAVPRLPFAGLVGLRLAGGVAVLLPVERPRFAKQLFGLIEIKLGLGLRDNAD